MTTQLRRSPTITPIIPDLVLGYASQRLSGNVLHKIIGRAEPDVTFRDASPRSGTLTFLFADRGAAFACEAAHSRPGVFYLADDDVPDIDMSYVVSGNVGLVLDPDTRTFWTVTVDYQALSSETDIDPLPIDPPDPETDVQAGVYGHGIYGA